jgi:hypothetical protein
LREHLITGERPKQKGSKKVDLLKTRLALDLVINPESIGEVSDIRTSTIYDILGKKIIIAQTEPRLTSSRLNKGIMISFLSEGKGLSHRYGFQAKIINFIEDYQLVSSEIEPAILIEQISLPKPYNLRMYYRMCLPLDAGFQISLNGQPGGIIDISLGGALVGMTIDQEQESMFEIGQTFKIALTIDGQTYDLEVQIKRVVFPDKTNRSQKMRMLACEFHKRTREFEQALERKLLYLQRELRSRMG